MAEKENISIKDALIRIGADIDLVKFILLDNKLAHYSEELLPPHSSFDVNIGGYSINGIPLNPESEEDKKQKASKLKKIWRKVDKSYGTKKSAGHAFWKSLLQSIKKEQYVLEKHPLYSENLSSTSPNKSKGRPKEKELFDTVWILKEYFIFLSGKANWSLITRVVQPFCKKQMDYFDLSSRWDKRKEDYEMLNGRAYLDNMRYRYNMHQAQMAELNHLNWEWLYKSVE